MTSDGPNYRHNGQEPQSRRQDQIDAYRPSSRTHVPMESGDRVQVGSDSDDVSWSQQDEECQRASSLRLCIDDVQYSRQRRPGSFGEFTLSHPDMVS